MGRLSSGLSYRRLGQGPPLVMALGGAADHATPAGFMRRMSLPVAAVFAGHFTVYVTSCKPGLAPGTTMARQGQLVSGVRAGGFAVAWAVPARARCLLRAHRAI
jgi:hypothetical protein